MGTFGKTPQGQDQRFGEGSLVTRFLASGDAGWDITEDEEVLLTDLLLFPDVVQVNWKDRTFLLNRTYLSRPKVSIE